MPSTLPGETLLEWSTRVAPSAQEGIEWLSLEAVTRMQHLTAALVHEAVATTLPQRSLLVELHAIRAHAGSWCDVAVCRDAVQQLMPLVAQVQTPLVFSNGDSGEFSL